MDEILIEQGFQLSACTTNECVVEAGKLMGVEHMVAGNIAKIDNLFTIDIRLIDVETGKVLKTATEDCECALKDVLTNSLGNVARLLAGLKVDKQTLNIKTYQPSIRQAQDIEHAENYSNSFGLGARIHISGDLSGSIYSIEYLRKFSNNFSISIEFGLGTHYQNIEKTAGINGHFFEPKGNPDLDFMIKLDYWFLKREQFSASVFFGYAIGGDRYKYYRDFQGTTEVVSNNELNSYKAIPFGISFNYFANLISINSITFDLGYFVDLDKLQLGFPYNVNEKPEDILIYPRGFYLSLKTRFFF